MPPPDLYSIDPIVGPLAGETIVSIRGEGFSEGTRVFFGDAPVEPVVLEKGTLLLAKTPAASIAGVVDVRVEAPDGAIAVRLGGFTYGAEPGVEPVAAEDGPPRIDALVPDRGPVRGKLAVRIVGGGFAAGVRVEFAGAIIPVTVRDARTLEIVTPARNAPGVVTVRVFHPSGAASERASFRYERWAVIQSITPALGPASGGTRVVITGRNFKPESRVEIGGVVAELVSATADRIEVVAPEVETSGPVDVRVVEPQGSEPLVETRSKFEYQRSPYGPFVERLEPRTVERAQGEASIAIVGAEFKEGCVVQIGGVDVPVELESPGRLRVRFTPRDPGRFDVRVRNPDRQAYFVRRALEVR